MKVFFKIFLILTPYIWKTKKSLYATIRTGIYLILGTLGATLSPILLAKILSPQQLLLGIPIVLFLSISVTWIFQNISHHLGSISFYNVTNEAIKIIRFKSIMQIRNLKDLHQLKFTNSEIIYACERVPIGIVNFMNSIFVIIIPNIICLISCWISIIYLNKNLGSKYLFFSLLAFLPSLFILKHFARSRHLVWKKGDEVRVSQNEILQNPFFSKTNKGYVEQSFFEKLTKEANAWYTNNNQNFLINIIFDILFFFTSTTFFLFFYVYFTRGNLPVDSLVIFSSYIFTMHKASTTVLNDLKNILTSVVDLDKIVNVLEISSHNEATDKETLTFQNFSLHVEHLSFSYGSANVLNNLSFTIKSGDKIALAGKSGVGKSTLCKLIAGVYDPTLGKIYLSTENGEKNLREISIEYVSQDCHLFSGTIEENLFLNGMNIPRSIKEYFFNRMEEKVTELGKNLSIGERKRIVLARALAKNPQLLILDEVFSGLDRESAEILLKETMDMCNTLIVCSHDGEVSSSLDKVMEL